MTELKDDCIRFKFIFTHLRLLEKANETSVEANA